MIRALLLLVLCLGGTGALAGQVLDRIAETRELRLGVRADAAPFSYIEDGVARGFTVDLCRKLAEAVRLDNHLPALSVTTVTVGAEDRFAALQEGRIDILCGATTVTLEREALVDFTIPIFATGVAALTGPESPPALRQMLAGEISGDMSLPRLRRALAGAALGARAGTTAEAWVRENLPGAALTVAADHRAGVAALAEGALDAYLADLAILKGQIALNPDRGLAASAFMLTYEPYALAIPLGEDDLRITLNRGLSELFRNEAFFAIYERHLGVPSAEERLFYNTGLGPD